MYPLTPNPNETEKEFAVYNKVVGTDYKYIARALPGTATTASLWQCKLYFNDGTTEQITFANGSADFKFIAANSTGYTYT